MAYLPTSKACNVDTNSIKIIMKETFMIIPHQWYLCCIQLIDSKKAILHDFYVSNTLAGSNL